MNRFKGASLRGGIPKTNTTMKTYTTPNIECIEVRMMGAIMDGSGMMTPPPVVDPNKDLAPKRVF
jgi:hypothetical protein